MTTTQQGEQPLVYTTGRHWPVLITSPYDTEPDEVETVRAPTYADAVRSAAYSYQAPYTAHVIPIPVNEHISAGPDPEEVTTPAVVQLSQALLAAHAPEHAVTSTEDRHEDRLAVMRIAAEAMRDSAAAIAEQPGEWSRLESLADRIRALPLPADNEDESADQMRGPCPHETS